MKSSNDTEKKKIAKKHRARLGEFLKAKRVAAGLSQREVAEALGYTSAQFISNWERNLSQPPIQVMKQIAKLYKTDENELFKLILDITLAETIEDLERKFKIFKK